MKRVTSILLSALIMAMLLPLGSCTHNDGDIGDLFGLWVLEQIYVDGAPDANYRHDITWSFQTDVIRVVQTDPQYAQYDEFWGTWSWVQPDKMLRLDFTHGTGEPQFDLPEELGLPIHSVIDMAVGSYSSKNLSLTYGNRTYVLKKL